MSQVGVVLAGGGARGAYEVGVLKYVLERLPADIGCVPRLDILTGTSVGAIHACALAARVDEPAAQVAELARHWAGLEVRQMLRPDACEVLATLLCTLGPRAACRDRLPRGGGLLDPAPLRALLDHVPFERIDELVRSGQLGGLAVSATHVATGRTVVFLQRGAGGALAWPDDPTTVPRRTAIRAQHALASAAIPFLFPAVRIGGEVYCDGALRQNVPLSPALHLGAEALLVVNPRYLGEATPAPEVARGREHGLPDAVFLLGKILNALLLDRMDADLVRLEELNAILRAGASLAGPEFLEALNRALGRPPDAGLREVRAVLVRASEDIGALAAGFVDGARFRRRTRGLLLRVLTELASGETRREADLLSYLLFDGDFARDLMALGERDARARHDALCALFAETAGAQRSAGAAG